MELKTQLIMTLPLKTRDLTSTTAVEWHLKVKGTKYNVALTKT